MIVWCLYDGSGIMGLPWAQAGHNVYCFNDDGGDHGAYQFKMSHPNLHFVNAWIDRDFDHPAAPHIIFAFPPCTLMSGSGSKHDREEDGLALAVEGATLVEKLGNKYKCPWMVENPVGKLSTLWRKPDYYFDPYQYGGYMAGDEEVFHPKMPVLDGYTKKTCIWAGNGFVMPEKKPVPHIGKFWGWAFLGGKSAKTKQLRSLTPRGFATAVFGANK